MLLQAKGFTDVVVSITDNNADVVLNMGEVTDAKRAQVEDIVKRKTNVEAQNIVITPISSAAGTEDGTGTTEGNADGTATETPEATDEAPAQDNAGSETDGNEAVDGSGAAETTPTE